MVWNWKGTLATAIIGAAILSVGFAISAITNSTMSNLQTQLQQSGLATAQRDAFQGSLNWWQIEKVDVFDPISEFVTIIGIIIIISSVIYAVLSISGELIDRTKKIKIEDAPGNEQPVAEPPLASQPVAQKTMPVHTTGFPVAAGILTIIAASFAIIIAFLAIAQATIYTNSYYYQQNLTYLVLPLFAGIWNFIAFALGLTAGLFSLKRKRFMMAIVGISLLIVGGFLSVLQTGTLGLGWIIGIPVIILSILSAIFVGISKNEFIG